MGIFSKITGRYIRYTLLVLFSLFILSLIGLSAHYTNTARQYEDITGVSAATVAATYFLGIVLPFILTLFYFISLERSLMKYKSAIKALENQIQFGVKA
jgi:Mn2+/Fe2+ NRAMP family transporter